MIIKSKNCQYKKANIYLNATFKGGGDNLINLRLILFSWFIKNYIIRLATIQVSQHYKLKRPV